MPSGGARRRGPLEEGAHDLAADGAGADDADAQGLNAHGGISQLGAGVGAMVANAGAAGIGRGQRGPRGTARGVVARTVGAGSAGAGSSGTATGPDRCGRRGPDPWAPSATGHPVHCLAMTVELVPAPAPAQRRPRPRIFSGIQPSGIVHLGQRPGRDPELRDAAVRVRGDLLHRRLPRAHQHPRPGAHAPAHPRDGREPARAGPGPGPLHAVRPEPPPGARRAHVAARRRSRR